MFHAKGPELHYALRVLREIHPQMASRKARQERKAISPNLVPIPLILSEI